LREIIFTQLIQVLLLSRRRVARNSIRHDYLMKVDINLSLVNCDRFGAASRREVTPMEYRDRLTLTEVSRVQYMYLEQILLNLEIEGGSSRR